MSTPEWPVPYYQRAFRHPANLEVNKGSLSQFLVPLHDSHALVAKESLKTNGEGYIVEAIENHFNLTNYKTEFKDASAFCNAYVDDILGCLSLAYEQNSKILSDFDLGDCIRQ